MAGFLVALAEGIRSTQCQVLSANAFVLGAIGRLNPVTRVTAPPILNGLRRLIGCDPANDVIPPTPPYSGGQCDCVAYDVNIQIQYTNIAAGGVPVDVNAGLAARVRGPFLGFTTDIREGSPNRVAYDLNCRGAVIGTGTVACGEQRIVRLVPGNSSPQDGVEIRVLSTTVTPVGSGANNCGDPAPVYPPPTSVNVDIDVTYEPDNGPQVTVPITLVYAPFEVNFNGEVSFPFTFDFGGLEFSGDVSFAPEVNVSINPPKFPRGTGDGTDTLPPGDPSQDVEPLDGDEKIIGVAVNSQITNSGKISSYSSPQIPPIFVPRLGSVKFAYSLGGATFWSSDIDVKDARTFIECPFSQGADAVVASPQLGVAMTAVPIRGYAIATTDDLRAS